MATPPPTDAVIVNKANDIGSLPRDQVRKISVGDWGNWPNSKRITVLTRQPGQPERKSFCARSIKMGDADVNVCRGDPIFGEWWPSQPTISWESLTTLRSRLPLCCSWTILVAKGWMQLTHISSQLAFTF